jgi:SAM-dependent methyltransferase
VNSARHDPCAVGVARDQQPEVELDRIGKALALIERSGLGAEIGPAYSPIASKRDGFNVHIIDRLNTAELREKYKGHGALSLIEHVDYVWHGEPLPELVGAEQRYDWIIASHVIEHLPDLVSFFNGCERILRPGGVLSLIIPDKRYAFDYFRPVSTTGELLDAFEQRRTLPSAGSVFDHHAYAAKRGENIAWSADDPGELSLVHTFAEARQEWKQAHDGDYTDVHIWRFTPVSFRLIVDDLFALGVTNLRICKVFDTVGCEFHVSLSALPSTPRTAEPDRLQTLVRLRNDESASVLSPVGGSPRGPLHMELSERERSLVLSKRLVLRRWRAFTAGLSRRLKRVAGEKDRE